MLVTLEIPKRLVLDTTVLIDHLRSKNRDTLASRLEGRAELATTIINRFELYYGAYKSKDVRRNLTSVKGVFSTLQVLSMTEGAAEQAGRLLAQLEAKGRPIESRDLFVGAIALEEGYAVLTDDLEHFERIPGVQVVEAKQLFVELDRLV
ncbi:type II toxin-antitoxin system VapC family toxin [Candidatus Bathyarchaeota archaeon]|nr:MAG: type II toxin-antitoxin system VapC family toxin [Candidatus Bathyarchaeota archaeon]